MNLEEILKEKISNIKLEKTLVSSGKVKKFDGNIIYCDPFPAPIGSLCVIKDKLNKDIMAEIIGFDEEHNMLAILNQNANIVVGCKVSLIDEGKFIDVDDSILGRVTDAFGNPLDDKIMLNMKDKWPLFGNMMNPLKRKPVKEPLDVGIKVINSLLTIGRGQ